MRISQYIVIRKSGYRYASRMTSKSPALAANELAVRVSIEIPDEAFVKPAFEAELKVPKEAVGKPIISAEVIDNVQEIIKQQTGFTVSLQAVEE